MFFKLWLVTLGFGFPKLNEKKKKIATSTLFFKSIEYSGKAYMYTLKQTNKQDSARKRKIFETISELFFPSSVTGINSSVNLLKQQKNGFLEFI